MQQRRELQLSKSLHVVKLKSFSKDQESIEVGRSNDYFSDFCLSKTLKSER